MLLHIVRFVLCISPILIVGAVGSQCTARRDQLQLSNTAVITAGELYLYMFLVVGKTRAPGENPRVHGENMQTRHIKALPQPGIELRTFLMLDDSANQC